jgi:hypothetical protein
MGRTELVGKVMRMVLFGRHRRGWKEILIKWTFSKQYKGFTLDFAGSGSRQEQGNKLRIPVNVGNFLLDIH